MERPEIVELFYSALVDPNDVEQLFQFLSPKVEWILSAADPQTSGEEIPPNAIKFSGEEGFRELAIPIDLFAPFIKRSESPTPLFA